jgi:putative FmdB family regulatory protein
MPTYDYKCANCGHVVEVVRGVNEAGPTVCPECGGLLRKQMSAPAIHFRGTGWAKKDARQAIAARAGKTESGESLKSGESGKPGESGKAGVAAESGGSSGSDVGEKSGEKDSGSGREKDGRSGGASGGKDSGKAKAGSSAAASGKE